MPLYQFECENCGNQEELLRNRNEIRALCSECGEAMRMIYKPLAYIRIRGKGLPARRKWMDNWTPQSPPFSTGSLHGARY